MDTTNTQAPEEEIKELALEKQDTSIVKIFQQEDIAHLTGIMKEITSLKRKYTPKKLEITDIENKDQAENLRLAIQVVRTKRTGLEKEKKEKTKPYRDTVEYINNAYDKATGALKDIQEPLDKIKADKDAKLLAKEKEEEIKQQQKLNSRVETLINAGAAWDGSYYAIGSEEFGIEQVSIGMVQLGPMTDEDFELLIDHVKQKELAIRDAKEEKKKADAQKALELQQQQELLDNQKKEQETNQKKLEEQQAAIKTRIVNTRSRELKSIGFIINVPGNSYVHPSGKSISTSVVEEIEDAAWDDLITETEQAIEKEQRLADLKKIRNRKAIEIGLETNNDGYSYKQNNFDAPPPIEENEESWNLYIEYATKKISELNAAELLQKNRYDRILPYAAFFDNKFLMDDLHILSDEDFESLFTEKKTVYETKIADDAKNLAAQQLKDKNEALAKEGDKAVWDDFVSRLNAVTIPDFQSEEFKTKSAKALKFIETVKFL